MLWRLNCFSLLEQRVPWNHDLCLMVRQLGLWRSGTTLWLIWRYSQCSSGTVKDWNCYLHKISRKPFSSLCLTPNCSERNQSALPMFRFAYGVPGVLSVPLAGRPAVVSLIAGKKSWWKNSTLLISFLADALLPLSLVILLTQLGGCGIILGIKLKCVHFL